MSRKQWKLSDFDKYLKPIHLGGKQHTLTVTHIGVEPVKSRKREWIVAGDSEDESGDEFLMILHFKEFNKPLRTNALSREVLRKAVGDDLPRLIGAKITIRVVTLKQFGGQECIEIVACELEKGRAPVAQVREPEPEEQWGEPEGENELPAEVVIAESVRAEPEQPKPVAQAEPTRAPLPADAVPTTPGVNAHNLSGGNGHSDALEALSDLCKKLTPNRAPSEDVVKRAIQTTAMRLSSTAVKDDDELRHAVVKHLFPSVATGSLKELSAGQLFGLRDWLQTEAARSYVNWVIEVKMKQEVPAQEKAA